MIYRREIDGLRALAVVPVILGHAGFSYAKGGFVGVDIFFVISGYLITTIIATDLNNKAFSILNFYERRLRRIIPALLFVMIATIPFAYFWMMPDEFKNFGQSLVATSLFANNILLAYTSDYWSLASIFKPFLHTWSLGVEEQFYFVFPPLLALLWKLSRNHTPYVIAMLFLLSLGAATWGVLHYPAASFYLLPTRAWELLAGAMAAYWLIDRGALGRDAPENNLLAHNFLSALGFSFIIFAIVTFDDSYLSPGPWIIIPVAGSLLIILFAVHGTFAHSVLSNSLMVGTGLISYSLYLWHQPLFALARVHEIEPLSLEIYACLIAATFVLAYLTWRFVETPFRDRAAFDRRFIFAFSLSGSLAIASFGLYLNYTYGMYWRIFDKSDKISDFDKRAYNQRVFYYKADHFADLNRKKMLVVGNSFARDFVNMVTETFDTKNLEIVYSDTAENCIGRNSASVQSNLFQQADIIVFANTNVTCVADNIAWSNTHAKRVFFVGFKDFGYNLNWIIRIPAAQRANQYNRISDEYAALGRREENIVPDEHFIPLMRPVMRDGMMPITDHAGKMLSTDRTHVTKYGAIYFGERALKPTAFGALMAQIAIQ